jgi:hypothetical protein
MKILFLCPDYYGIYKIIEKGIKENIDCELKTLVFKDYEYKNLFQKIENFISKTFLKKNKKKIWSSKLNVKLIKPNDHFDVLFIICPDILQNQELQYITERADKSIVYYWDSFDNIPRYKRTLPYFDIHYSFEKRDVDKYQLQFLTNFYYKTETPASTIEYDVFFIGALDNRISSLLDIANATGKRYKKIIVQSKNIKNKKKYIDKGIELIENPITFYEAEGYFEKSKVIIDIHKKIQNGLTFRVFEAIGRKKKIITTNKDIVHYDFYNPNNIFVWDKNSKEIPSSFFDSPYEELEQSIYEKYSLKNWINTLFEVKE